MTISPRRRTWISFSFLIGGFLAFYLVWSRLNSAEPIEGAPAPMRQVFELNGRVWKSLFNERKRSECAAPTKGKIPRVNGKIGLDADFDAKDWKLEIVADEQDPASPHFSVTLQDILALPRTDTATNFRCIEGWSEDMAFAGVKFSEFMKAYNLRGKPYVGLETVDGEYYVSIDLESMLHSQTLLAYEMNGEPLKPANGAPLRLVIPVKYGIKNIKRIGKIFFSDRRPPDYWAEQGYDWYAGL